MIIFDGRHHASLLDEKIRTTKSNYRDKILAIVQVGDNPSSEKYIKVKISVCENLGVKSIIYRVQPRRGSGYTEIIELLKKLSTDNGVSSIIVQLPLPETNMYSALDYIVLEKDVDFLSKARKDSAFDSNLPKYLTMSPVVRSLEYYLDSNNLNHANLRKVGIIGQGELVGKPCHNFMSSRKFNIEVITNYVEGNNLDYDLLILSTGVPKLINPKDIRPLCNVVDFGSAVVNGKTVGDLNTDEDLNHLGIVSKSPGGMGPLVVRFLIMNHLRI